MSRANQKLKKLIKFESDFMLAKIYIELIFYYPINLR